MDRKYATINNLLAEAAGIIRSRKKATEDIEPTEGYKRGQIEALISFANAPTYG